MIDLKQFCGPQDDTRPYLRVPFTFEGDTYVYATDGYIAVRVLKSNGYEGEIFDSIPLSTAGMRCIFDHNAAEYTAPIPVSAPERLPCDSCGQTGKIKAPATYECGDCDGDGEFQHGNHRYSCKECDGDGKVKSKFDTVLADCEKCQGTGQNYGVVKFGHAFFSGKYVAKIAALPNAKIQVRDAFKNAHFTFDDGEGVVMPVRMG